MKKVTVEFNCKENTKKNNILFIIIPTIGIMTTSTEVSIEFAWLFGEFIITYNKINS